MVVLPHSSCSLLHGLYHWYNAMRSIGVACLQTQTRKQWPLWIEHARRPRFRYAPPDHRRNSVDSRIVVSGE